MTCWLINHSPEQPERFGDPEPGGCSVLAAPRASGYRPSGNVRGKFRALAL